MVEYMTAIVQELEKRELPDSIAGTELSQEGSRAESVLIKAQLQCERLVRMHGLT